MPLETIASDRNRQRKHIERASVVLASIVGPPVQVVAAALAPAQWCGVGNSASLKSSRRTSHETPLSHHRAYGPRTRRFPTRLSAS
jgi:hypothetical protein